MRRQQPREAVRQDQPRVETLRPGTGAQANGKLDKLGIGLDIADNPLKTLKTAKGIFGKT
jgi:hypothetical protein